MSRIVAALIVCFGLFALVGAIRESKAEACSTVKHSLEITT